MSEARKAKKRVGLQVCLSNSLPNNKSFGWIN